MIDLCGFFYAWAALLQSSMKTFEPFLSSLLQLQVLINGLQHLAPPRLRSNLQIVETYIKVKDLSTTTQYRLQSTSEVNSYWQVNVVYVSGILFTWDWVLALGQNTSCEYSGFVLRSLYLKLLDRSSWLTKHLLWSASCTIDLLKWSLRCNIYIYICIYILTG